MCNGFNRNLIAFSRVPEGPGGSCRAYFQRKPLRYVVVAIAQPRSHVCHSNAAQASHAATQPEKGNLVWNMLLTTRLALSQVRLQVTLADERYSNIFAACRRQRGFMCKDASVSCETSREGTGANGPWNVTAENLWWKAARLDNPGTPVCAHCRTIDTICDGPTVSHDNLAVRDVTAAPSVNVDFSVKALAHDCHAVTMRPRNAAVTPFFPVGNEKMKVLDHECSRFGEWLRDQRVASQRRCRP
ncbi:hypothetical protein M8818_000909 [Zalaria obscura]|uniref:Uncharacterized protein n=1 Tax=Zalaria obscura TaxID=2024903 RepID=A0ACC3SM01_9PEZI